MKSMLKYAIPFYLLVLCAGCKRTNVDTLMPDNSSSSSNLQEDLKDFLKSAAQTGEKFSLNASTGGTFTTSKGNIYTIPPNAFMKADGSPVVGMVDITASEITKASEMILNDKPTNALVDSTNKNPKDTLRADTAKGGMLNSLGEFKVDAKQGNDALQLKPGAQIDVVVPTPKLPDQVLGAKAIPLWSGDTVIQKNPIGYDFENNVVFTSTPVPVQIGTLWEQTYQDAPVQQTVINNQPVQTLNFGIPKLGEWRNTDVLVVVDRRTTCLGYFTNVFNEASLTNDYFGLQPNMLFFKKKGDNVMVKLYNPILNAPVGKNGFLSYQNAFGIGIEGTFLALVNKDGKYYAQKLPMIIPEPESGKNYVGVNFTLTEVTKDQMLDLVRSMDNE
jgi:hypothetical protein